MTGRMTTRASNEGLGCATAAPRPQLQADKAYDIAGRPPVLPRRGNRPLRTGDRRLANGPRLATSTAGRGSDAALI